jgi:adenylate cyclase, class 2
LREPGRKGQVKIMADGDQALEIEMKFRVTDVAHMQRVLREWQVELEPAVEQVDHYFNHPSRNFAVTDEAVRVRRIGGQCLVTYKGPKLDTVTKTRRELEIGLEGGLAAGEKMASLLRALGFREVAQVHKRRQRGELQWEGTTFELVLDEVPRAGTFVELETQGQPQSFDELRDRLIRLAQAMGLTASERRSYLEMVLEADAPA